MFPACVWESVYTRPADCPKVTITMHCMRKILMVAAVCLLSFLLGSAAEKQYQLLINGAPSTVKVIEGKDGLLVPLTLPANSDAAEWTVSLVRDSEARKVEVTLTQVKRKVRGGYECGYCGGSGKCAQDYPAGSGLNYQGQPEYYCNGNGRCYHCSGTGKFE